MKNIILVIFSLVTLSFFDSTNIDVEDIQQVNVFDYVNQNYEYVSSKLYEIKNKDGEFIMYDNKGVISQAEFERKRLKVRNLFGKIKNRTNERQAIRAEKNSAKRKQKYDKYLENAKTHRVRKVSKASIAELVEIVNSDPINFSDIWDLKKSKQYPFEQDEFLDSTFVKLNFEMLDNFSFYPEVRIEVLTLRDTFVYFSTSQNDPPMPWTILHKGIEVGTYDDRLNKWMLNILPEKPILNRDRLRGNLDSLFYEMETEIK